MTLRRDRVSRIPEAVMLGVSFAIAIGISVLSYRSGEAARLARQQQDLTLEIERLNAALVSTLTDAETGQRGFLLTGQERYLDSYINALAAIPQTLDRFRAVTAEEPDQAARASMIGPLVSQKLAELKTTIDLRRENKTAEALAIVNTDRGKAYMDQIRSVCNEIERAAAEQLDRFQSAAERSASTFRAVGIGGSVILAAFLVVSTFAVFRGMNRRDELLRRALASEKLTATTLSGIADGVIATDEKAHITFINPVAQKLTGWTQREAIGAHISQVFPIINETTRLNADNPLEKALHQGEAVRLANHTNLISKTGVEMPIDDSAAPLKDEEGSIIGAVLVFRDVSARRELDKQLRNANNELQQFVDAAAHDLRSPLNTVGVMAELLERQFQLELGEKGHELIGYLTSGIGRMRRLLDDLLAFARASHFDKEADVPISLDIALQSVLDNLHAEIQSAGATVTSEPLPVAAIDAAHALQLFQNLINNAIKYRNQDGPLVHVRAGRRDSEWVISVTDNGIGIEAEYLEQIFKPFKRLHGDAYPGSGIGLSTCQKIVRGYGGRIWAESVAGKGSTFFFTLPAP